MKNRRALMMMALAVLLGLLAVLLASHWLLRQTPAGKGHVVVAAADVSLGQRLAPEMLRLAEWPAESLPQGALQDPLKLAGRVLKSSVLRGEPLSEAKLAPIGTLGGLSALITEGRRAITVRVNDVIGVAGFALPGNYVDIIVSTQQDASERSHSRNISKIVLERILVLAVAQEVGRDETRPRVVNAVTLEVTPAQAENLDLARSVGSLSLVLRNQVDPQPGITAGATKLTLLGAAPEPEPVAAPPTPVSTPRPAAPRAARTVATVGAKAAPSLCSGVIDGARQWRECF
ncbi:Flp pilus assembly protein CpaB [Janthinobacterium aquaticum]|uniref:Flp pilus assembly protein CpaB n=1 Tax=Janthinobacterium sp. FT58W TaxID=2654254 RepID=UPI0012651941|nr:Flp pilus assembly protein CpaB [Janthinobacterium sp. FT58W]KAB8040167.1 Flp pilus assembly protein CpaB [Janthinobacterium sp. FT58W]